MLFIKKIDLSSRKSGQVMPKSKVFLEMKVLQIFKKNHYMPMQKIASTIAELRQLFIRNVWIYSCYFYFAGTDHFIAVGLFCLGCSDPRQGPEMSHWSEPSVLESDYDQSSALEAVMIRPKCDGNHL